MTKRIVTLLLAVVMVLSCSLFVACGGDSTTEAKKPASSPTPGTSNVSEDPASKPVSDNNQSSPVSVDPPQPSSPEPPDVPEEPEDQTSQEWIKWLVEYGRDDEKYADLRSLTGGIYLVTPNPNNEGYTGSGWETWNLVGATDGDTSKTRFHLCYKILKSEGDFTPQLNAEDYAFEWVLWVKKDGSDGDYQRVVCNPWGYGAIDDETPIYRLATYDAGLDLELPEGQTTVDYEFVFTIYDKESEELLLWKQDWLAWTDASEYYLNQAKEHKWLLRED